VEVDAVIVKRRRARVLGILDTDLAAVLSLLFLVFLAFAPWWAGGRLFAPLDLLDGLYEPWHDGAARVNVKNHFTSDGITQYVIYHKIAERSFAEDGAVGWSDLTMGGRPEYANTMAGHDDWTMQLHRFLDFWTAWHVGLIAQLLVAALGMFVFLRSQRISPLVALLGALAYAANSQFVILLYIRSPLAGFAWVPWVAWAMHRHRGGHAWAWPLVPLFLALAFLGGTVQTSAFVALVVFGIWLGWLRETPLRRWWADTGHVLAWGVLGAGLAAFALYPNTLTLAESMALGMDRGQLGYKHGLVEPLLSAIFIAAQAVPTLLGSPRSMDLSKALALELHDIAFFGFIPVVLAYRSALLRSAPAAARWLVAFGLLIPLTPLAGPLYHRVQLVFIFGGVWAFAWYWEHADRERIDPVLRRLFHIFLALLALWLMGSVASVLLQERLQGRIDAYLTGRIASGRAGVFGAVREGWLLERGRNLLFELRLWHPRQMVAVLAALLGFVALRLRARRGVSPSAALLLAVLVVELGAFAAGWVTAVDPAEHPPYGETPDIVAVRERVGAGRVHIVDHDAAPSLFPPNTLAMYGIATIEAYETVGLPTMWRALGEAADAGTLGRMAVTHAVSRPGDELGDGWVAEYRGERLTLWRNEHALPRYLALRAGSGAWPRAGEGVGVVRVEGTMNRRRLEVPAGADAVRVAENWSEGWRYRVAGGEWKAVEMAADRSMVLALAPAPVVTRVELDYHPRRRVVGWWLTTGALLATLLGWGLVARRR
jgi:hypothetical protein